MTDFSEFKLSPKIFANLEKIGFKEPTPIQTQAIPLALEGKDIIASAQTGTGKTCAFLLPSIYHIEQEKERKRNGPKILILVPTRELALQVAQEAKKHSRSLPYIVTITIYGGVPYPIQKRDLKRKHDILVATPGRLIDHMERGMVDLSNVTTVILDEADRMLDMGFVDPVRNILKATPEERQTLLFSATLDKRILNLSKEFQKDPHEIQIKPTAITEGQIEKFLYYADDIQHKGRLLDNLLSNDEIDQTIIFTSTKSQADKLADELSEKGHSAESLHGDLNQRQRDRTLLKLRKGAIKILVATDVAARGIDISTISHVINFDLPFQAEDYVHRIGRTGRAGAKGVAITFATNRDRDLLGKIEKLTGSAMTVQTIEGLEPTKRMSGEKRGFGSRGNSRGFGPRRNFSEGGQREERPRNFGSRKPREEGSRSFNDSPREFKPRHEGSRSFNDSPREFKPRHEGSRSFNDSPREFKPRHEGSRNFNDSPREFKPRQEGSRDFKPGNFGSRKPREEGSRSFNDSPREFKPRENGKRSFGKPAAGKAPFRPKAKPASK